MTTRIAGTFADFKLIKGRKVAQIVIEIPIEQADAIVAALGGLPNPAVERWVAMAPVNTEAARAAPGETAGALPAQGEADSFRVSEGSRPASASPALDRRPVALAGRVKLACDRSDFYDWLRRESAYEDAVIQAMDDLAPHGGDVSWQAISEAVVKRLCGVERKRDIVPGSRAGEKWRDLWFQFTHSDHGRAA